MSTWTSNTRRRMMNDSNRYRFSSRSPPFENVETSPGPCLIIPNKPSLRTLRSAKITAGYLTDRPKVMRNGELLTPREVLEPKLVSPRAMNGASVCLTSHMPRFPNATPEEVFAAHCPGPGAYTVHYWDELSAKKGPIPLSSAVRPCAEAEDKPAKINSNFSNHSEAAVPSWLGGKKSAHSKENVDPTPPILHSKKSSFAHAPRHMNIANINSFTAMEKNAAMDTPNPGTYVVVAQRELQSTKTHKFSLSPRRSMMVISKNH